MGSEKYFEIPAADFYRGKNHREAPRVILKSVSKLKSFGTLHFSEKIKFFHSPKTTGWVSMTIQEIEKLIAVMVVKSELHVGILFFRKISNVSI